MKIRFYCWLVITIFFIVLLFKSLLSGFNLNTNIMSLLPKSQQNPVVAKATNLFSNNMGKQIIFLINDPDKTTVQTAADQFFNQINKDSLFTTINYKITTNEQQAWGGFYFPYRLSLLTPAQKQLLQQNKIEQIQQAALAKLYSPMGITNSNLLANDPYFLFQDYLMSLPKPASKVELHNQRMMVYANNRWYVMINAQLKDDSFSISNQNKVIKLIQTSKQNVIKTFPNSNILMSGMLFYAKAGADEAQNNISTIGIGSLIGIILLVLLTFRSLSPLLFTLMSALIGFMAAFAVTQYFFGSVYLFTLVFGASLIGISVDYAFFYYADQLLGGIKWNAERGLKNILPGISLGLLNIVLAYIILSFTPFPGLQQLAVFAITGLIMSYATVVCVFPLVLKPKKYTFKPPLLRLSNYYLNLWRNMSLKKIIIIYSIIFVFAAIGILRLKPNDDIRILESVPTHLKQAETKIKQILGSNMGMDFYVITGDTPAQTLTHEQIVTHKINAGYLAITSYLPSITTQQENFNLVKTKLINTKLITYLEKIGVNKPKAKQIKNNLAKIKFKPLTIATWLQSPVSKSMRFLWLGKINNEFVSIVLSNDKSAHNLPFATYINKADEISKIFKTYRQRSSMLLVLAYIALFILLLIRYALKRAFIYFLPPVGACMLSLGALGWLGVPLTLFNVLALILILGIGVDYILFFAETKSNYNSTMLAVSLSAIITILSFGLLAFSTTAVIHYFGITVLVGITSAFVLAPLVAREKLL